ncbi:MAG: 3-hydroxyacyl-CoA dehydrogenase family protein [Marinifilaceae bacterium]|jgi:3-hydroxyacyl-CoA dehydrogenase|nr:3-hydroxyacyl-CoA dehydrogenase family protein [Marinifilaceae bacterium]
MEKLSQLENISVLGAAGKMGSGITVLLALELGKLKLERKFEKTAVLNAIDLSQEALAGLKSYLKNQLTKYAEKNTQKIKDWYRDKPEIAENKEVIEAYVSDVMDMVCFTDRMESAYNSKLIFEAIKEDRDLKIKIFSQIKENNADAWFLTNTSSIPIGSIEEANNLKGSVLGYHFYNPPVIQKLLEIIKTDNTNSELFDFALELGKSMRKILIESKDVAGFIGNGHFMRDAIYALHAAAELSAESNWPKAVYMMDTICRDLLVRPMGIFQLMDYVGIDVTKFILSSMQPYFPEEKLYHKNLDKMFELSVIGGQHSDGSQKDGFFKYEKGKITHVFDIFKEKYIEISEIKEDCDKTLGDLPSEMINWKQVMKSENKDELLSKFFETVHNTNSMACNIATAYGNRSMKIAKNLVKNEVAKSTDDINTVMKTGFFHAYGPVNEYFK